MTRIVFFGNEQLAQGVNVSSTPIFSSLANDNHYEIVALVLPRDPSSSSRRNKKTAIFSAAEQLQIPIIFADKEQDFNKTLQDFNAEIAVLASYGKIVKQSTIDVFPRGIVNIHPSLLPKYRGSTPLETVILNGDSETGVSLMQLSAQMDAGGIFAQEKLELNSQENKQELYEKLANLGASMLVDSLPYILDGTLKAQPQDDSITTYCQLIDRARDGLIDPKSMTATECERRIRAFSGWPKTRLNFQGREVIVTEARVLNDFQGDNWPDLISCKDNTYLQIVRLIAPGGREMKTADYLRGLKD